MTDPGSESTASPRPSLRRCPRCLFSLRGLPANHACPECGLRYDEQSLHARVRNPLHVLIVAGVPLLVGAVIFRVTVMDALEANAVEWQNVVQVLGAVGFLIFGLAKLFQAVRRYVAGYRAAVVTDGMIICLPEAPEGLIPWSRVAYVSVRDKHNKQGGEIQLLLHDVKNPILLGKDPVRLFPTMEETERFASAILARMPHVDPEPESPQGDLPTSEPEL
jgi:uncharacterized protein (DUF983 family)